MNVSPRIFPSAELAAVVGEEHLLADDESLLPLVVDGKKPAAVVRPGSVEEIAEVVKVAVAEKLAVVVTGARTKLRIGLPPRQFDLALDMTRLDRILAYDPGDLTLSIEAGVPLRDVQGTLAQHGQFLPLAVPYMYRATAGGTIASGVDSPLRQSYGTARDYILGLEFVTGAGTVAKSGGRVVKNVTGYDIHKLLAGSLGTLGIITKINLRTFPRPSNRRGFLATFDSFESALALRHRIARSPLAPLTLESISPGTVELFNGDTAAHIEPKPIAMSIFSNRNWTLVTQFAGNDKVIARCESELRDMAELCGARSAEPVGGDLASGVFGRLREFVPIALESSPAATIVKMSVLPSQIADLIEVAANAADEGSLKWAAMARGVGIIDFALFPAERTEQTRNKVAEATSKIFAGCANLDGNATIPWCPAEWKPTLNIWGPNRGDFDLMRKVKTLFDPGDVLSPGRFAGGI